MAVARALTADQRAEIFGRLVARNRIVGGLRVAVPALGLLAALLLVGQIWLVNLESQYGVSGIRIDRGNMVVETPQYSEIGGDGTRYLVAAHDARTPLAHPGVIEMAEPRLSLIRPEKSPMHARAATGTVDTERHYATAPGLVSVTSDDGLYGTVYNVRADMYAQVTVADGPVDLTFPDGSHLTAANLRFDGNTSLWSFDRATLVVPNLPVRSVSWMNVFAVFAADLPETVR
jgi:lipopolysaccharide export system protein LptC